VKHELLHNINYRDLLMWIDKFRQLDIPRVSANTPTRHILEPIKNLDTVYEAWIFLEFVVYLDEKRILFDFRMRDHPHCKFSYYGRVVTFWYEKKTRGLLKQEKKSSFLRHSTVGIIIFFGVIVLALIS
jgi:hypothetical protein